MLVAAEDARLRAHFAIVLDELVERDVSHLSRPVRARRRRVVRMLGRYARSGRYPRNPDFVEPTPYFVDAVGTRCAVGHLAARTGARTLVADIARHANNATVAELAVGPFGRRLARWLDKVGLSAREAARIQPGYCHLSNASSCYCMGANQWVGSTVVAVVTEASADGASTARVERVIGAQRVSVGDSVTFFGWSTTVGERYVGPFLADNGLATALRVEADGRVETSCDSGHSAEPPRLTVDEMASIWNAESCEAEVAEYWPKANDSVCEGGSCAVGGADLLVVPMVAAVWFGRAAQRRRIR